MLPQLRLLNQVVGVSGDGIATWWAQAGTKKRQPKEQSICVIYIFEIWRPDLIPINASTGIRQRKLRCLGAAIPCVDEFGSPSMASLATGTFLFGPALNEPFHSPVMSNWYYCEELGVVLGAPQN